MSKERKAHIAAANDNSPKQHRESRLVKVCWPVDMPVTCTELDLLELYLSDLMLLKADNDN